MVLILAAVAFIVEKYLKNHKHQGHDFYCNNNYHGFVYFMLPRFFLKKFPQFHLKEMWAFA